MVDDVEVRQDRVGQGNARQTGAGFKSFNVGIERLCR